MKTKLNRILAMLMVVCILCSLAVMPASAATVEEATIDTEALCQLNIYKYDFTNAAKDGVWSAESYVSTGQYDGNVNNILGSAVRDGDTDNVSDLTGNGTSNGYAIKGVEYTYLKVAEITTYSEVEDNMNVTKVLYGFDAAKATALLAAIGLDADDRYANADPEDGSVLYFLSDTLVDAMQTALLNDPTGVKNALETYIKSNGGTAMPLTDGKGYTHADGLPVGLYLLVETKVPEMVTCTTNPFFVSLPMTTVNGGGDGTTGNNTQVTNGGHEWLYNVTVYPKNESGIVTLDKSVREAQKDTGTHNGTTNDITDGYDHNATASTGDVVEYQILSTLPTITSAATAISVYTFQDVLSKGLTYDTSVPVKIEFFSNADCKSADLVATWLPSDATPKFTVTQLKNADGSTTMTIAMTEAGLAEINATAATAGNVNSGVTTYAGYSNYTMRITYAAIVNGNETVVYGDEGNPNEVVLTWSRTSSQFYDTLVDDAHVYTYGIDLIKTFSDGKDDQELFNNVLFKIYNATDKYYITAKLNEAEGVWYVTGHTTQESSATAVNPVTWNDQKGHLVVKGLEPDTYIITELETADGYTLLKDDITVVITATEDPDRPCTIYSNDVLGVIQNDPRYNFDGGLDLRLANIPQAAKHPVLLTAAATVDGNEVNMLNDDKDTDSPNALCPLTVVNTRGFDLPQTGQTGAKWMPIIGGSLVGCAALFLMFFLLFTRKKENETA